jgi:hypothetical protein
MTGQDHSASLSCRAGWTPALGDSAQGEPDNGRDAARQDDHQPSAPPLTFEFPGLTEQRVKDFANSPARRIRAVVHD